MMFNPKVTEITNLYADYNANKITLGELHDGIDAILRAERRDGANDLWDKIVIASKDSWYGTATEYLEQLEENK